MERPSLYRRRERAERRGCWRRNGRWLPRGGSRIGSVRGSRGNRGRAGYRPGSGRRTIIRRCRIGRLRGCRLLERRRQARGRVRGRCLRLGICQRLVDPVRTGAADVPQRNLIGRTHGHVCIAEGLAVEHEYELRDRLRLVLRDEGGELVHVDVDDMHAALDRDVDVGLIGDARFAPGSREAEQPQAAGDIDGPLIRSARSPGDGVGDRGIGCGRDRSGREHDPDNSSDPHA